LRRETVITLSYDPQLGVGIH